MYPTKTPVPIPIQLILPTGIPAHSPPMPYASTAQITQQINVEMATPAGIATKSQRSASLRNKRLI